MIELSGLAVFMCGIIILLADMHINIYVRWRGGDGKDSTGHTLLTIAR